MRILAAWLMAATIASTHPASSATMKTSLNKEGNVVISLNGKIIEGDAAAVRRLIVQANGSGKLVSGIKLNSPGGDLSEGILLAILIKSTGLATVVPAKATCTSACFLVFAAGVKKFASYSSTLGVHGASTESGQEHSSGTVRAARILKELGVPAGIIVDMVDTPHDSVAWLTVDGLRAMGTVLSGERK